MGTFSDLAELYDTIYFRPDVYERESRRVAQLIEAHRRTPNTDLLDLACGTATHVAFLSGDHRVTGLDASEEMLAIARRKHPEVEFHCASMVDFDLARRFGAVICLYGSIGFVRTVERLGETLRTLANHLEPGGVLVLVPWSTREDFAPAVVSGRVVRDGVQIVNMERVALAGDAEVDVTYHYLVGSGGDVRHLTGHHPPIGLFSRGEYEAAVAGAGLEIAEQYRGDDIHMGMAYVCRKPGGCDIL